MKRNASNIINPAKLAIIRDYLKRFPDHGNQTIAKAVYKNNPGLWPDAEAVRSQVRKITGSAGKGHGHLADPKLARNNGVTGAPPMPKSLASNWDSYALTSRRILVVSDIHIPYHDDSAVESMMRHAAELNPDCILLNGDIIDFFSVSKWESNPAFRNIVKEIEGTKAFLAHINARFPKAKLIYKKGNHEERLDFYIWRKCPELWGMPNLKLEHVLELENLKCELVEDQRIIKAGKLSILHGHEFPRGMSSPVNPARGYFMRGHECVLAGHYHRTSEHTEPTMLGRSVTTWSAGCLCGLHPEYARLNKWNHGFAFVELDKDGGFRVQNFRIRNGKVL